MVGEIKMAIASLGIQGSRRNRQWGNVYEIMCRVLSFDERVYDIVQGIHPGEQCSNAFINKLRGYLLSEPLKEPTAFTWQQSGFCLTYCFVTR
jgi:hypothetical protein